jgi:hypothetical protein
VVDLHRLTMEHQNLGRTFTGDRKLNGIPFACCDS